MLWNVISSQWTGLYKLGRNGFSWHSINIAPVMELKNFRSLQPYPVIVFYSFDFSPSPPPQYLYPPQFYLCDWTNLLLVVNLVLGGVLGGQVVMGYDWLKLYYEMSMPS